MAIRGLTPNWSSQSRLGKMRNRSIFGMITAVDGVLTFQLPLPEGQSNTDENQANRT